MSIQISNKFTETFGIKTPIISAPMAYAATPQMAAAVINAGGLGFLGAGNEPAKKLVEDIETTKKAVGSGKHHLIGMGFVGWVLDMSDPSKDPRLTAALEQEIGSVWFAFGNDLGKYIAQVRDFDKKRSHKTKIFAIVNTLEEAKQAAHDWKVDVLVVQGAEAGGRGSSYSPPLSDFLLAVMNAIPNGPFIVAAGGITTGAQIASMLTLGAAAAVLGTRFLFTPECMWPDNMKSALLEAGADSTVRSPAYDITFPPGVWPKGCEARCIKNRVLDDYVGNLSVDERKKHIASGDKDYLVIFAGIGVTHVNQLQSTQDVMNELSRGTVAALKSAPVVVA